MFFNWYLDHWWLVESSCTKNGLQAKNLEKLVRNSLVLDHYPRIEDKDADTVNVGNIVSIILYCS